MTESHVWQALLPNTLGRRVPRPPPTGDKDERRTTSFTQSTYRRTIASSVAASDGEHGLDIWLDR